MRQVERKYRTHHQHHHLPGTPLIRLLAQEPHTMTIMMDMEPTKLEPDTKVSTRECAARGRGALEGVMGHLQRKTRVVVKTLIEPLSHGESTRILGRVVSDR